MRIPVHESSCSGLHSIGLSSLSYAARIFVLLSAMVVCCVVLALLCDRQLHTVLHRFSNYYAIPKQISAVTFLAIGGSIPELAIHLMAVIGGSDIGVASIYGAGVYNLTLNFAMTCFVTTVSKHGNRVYISSTVRDVMYYILTVSLLYIFNKDGEISFPETLVMVASYPLYILLVLVTQDRKLVLGESILTSTETTVLLDKSDEPESLSWFNIICYPVIWFFRFTIPNPDIHMHSAFAMCLVYVILLAFGIMEIVQRIGCLTEIDTAMLGMVFVSVGTSLPDTILMATEARKGHASMSLSGLIGSNIFDLLLGLGIPWAISSAAYGRPVLLVSKRLLDGVYLLFLSVVAMLISLHLSNYTITPKTGILPFIAYAAYLAFEAHLAY